MNLVLVIIGMAPTVAVLYTLLHSSEGTLGSEIQGFQRASVQHGRVVGQEGCAVHDLHGEA